MIMQMSLGYGIRRSKTMLTPYSNITTRFGGLAPETRIGTKITRQAAGSASSFELDFHLNRSPSNATSPLGIGIGINGRF